MESEKIIAISTTNQEHIILALQEKLRNFGLNKNETKVSNFANRLKFFK